MRWRPLAGVERQLADVTDRKQLAKLGSALRGVPIDVLFCNAGISGKRGMALGSLDYDSWEEVLRVNLLGAAAVAEASGMTLPYATSRARRSRPRPPCGACAG
jgi:NAD(P)-dependent dehydrogenase (short-subunit alcohol dehydrogenase family)